ncbi:MAG: hypothetical protein IJI10_01950 [Eubacterium sp.]|nr:hypothetical protein [Eubacterium sp.]
MAEDKMKNVQKLDKDDLDNVNGGFGLGDFGSSILGINRKASSIMKTVRTAEHLAGSAAEKKPEDAGAGINKTVTAFCPVCGKDTEFEIFSGARAKCSVCGNIRLDM